MLHNRRKYNFVIKHSSNSLRHFETCIQAYLCMAHSVGGMCYLLCGMMHMKESLLLIGNTGPDGAVVMSSANGLVGTGFAYRYRLQPRACF